MLPSKSFLYNLLSTDATILSIVGSTDQIYFSYPDSFETVPLICYIEDNAPSTDYADNVPFASGSDITIDVYTAKNVSTTALVTAIESVLVNNLYAITFSGDVPEPDVRLQHRVIKCSRKFTAEDFA